MTVSHREIFASMKDSKAQNVEIPGPMASMPHRARTAFVDSCGSSGGRRPRFDLQAPSPGLPAFDVPILGMLFILCFVIAC